MSRRALKFTPAAIAHLQEIARYTEETWGEEQRDRYIERLYEGFEAIRQSPLAGRGRDELREGLRSRRIEHHIAYYLVSPKTITIAAILHERMDPHKHL